MTNKKKMTDRNKTFIQAIGRIRRTPGVETNQDNSVDTEQSNGENGEKFSSTDEYIDSLKQENAMLKGQIEILQEMMLANTQDVDGIEKIMEWRNSLMPELFGSHTGRNAIAVKIKEKVKKMYGNEGYVAKIKVSESAINNLCYGIDTPEYRIVVNLKLDVAYDYVVDCHGIGLCFDNGSVVYLRIGDWGDFEVVDA